MADGPDASEASFTARILVSDKAAAGPEKKRPGSDPLLTAAAHQISEAIVCAFEPSARGAASPQISGHPLSSLFWNEKRIKTAAGSKLFRGLGESILHHSRAGKTDGVDLRALLEPAVYIILLSAGRDYLRRLHEFSSGRTDS